MPFSVIAWFLSSYCVCHSTEGRMAQTAPLTSCQIEPILVHISLLSISILFQKSLWTEPRSVHYPSPLSFNHFPPTFVSCYVLVWLLFSVYCVQVHREGTSLWTEDKAFVVRRKFAPQTTNEFLEKVQGQLSKAGKDLGRTCGDCRSSDTIKRYISAALKSTWRKFSFKV